MPLESTAGTAGPNLQEAITQLALTFCIAHYERKSSAAPPECKIFNQNAKRPPDGREIPEKPFFLDQNERTGTTGPTGTTHKTSDRATGVNFDFRTREY